MLIADKNKESLKSFFAEFDELKKKFKIKLEIIDAEISDNAGYLGTLEDNIDCYSIISYNEEEIFSTQKK